MTGDPTLRCGACGQTYYLVNGHNCQFKSAVDFSWGNSSYPSVTHYQAMSSPPWECPRCHQIWAYWVPKCDCTPEPPKCIICGKASAMMDVAPYPSKHDGEPVCQECIAGFIDANVKVSP